MGNATGNPQAGAAALLEQIKTVDGAGSGLDADTLDGLHATSFMAQGTKFVTAIDSLPNGIFAISAQVSRPANFPFDAFNLISIHRSEMYQYQIALSVDARTPAIKIRQMRSGIWSQWVNVGVTVTSSDQPMPGPEIFAADEEAGGVLLDLRALLLEGRCAA